MMSWWLCRHRWARFFRHVAEAWHSFKWDVVVVHEDLPAHHSESITACMFEDIIPEGLENMRNFPKGRGFTISRDGYIWKATDGQSMYWLNNSNERWICMEGPDADLPRNE